MYYLSFDLVVINLKIVKGFYGDFYYICGRREEDFWKLYFLLFYLFLFIKLWDSKIIIYISFCYYIYVLINNYNKKLCIF